VSRDLVVTNGGRPRRDAREDTAHLGEGDAQRRARAVVLALHGTLRAIRMYPVENAAVQKTLGDLDLAVQRVFETGSEVTIRHAGDCVFVNDTRLRLAVDNFAAVSGVITAMTAVGLGALRVRTRPPLTAWAVLLAGIRTLAGDGEEDGRLGRLDDLLESAGVGDFELEEPVDEAEQARQVEQRERSRQTYLRSLEVTREVMSEARLGRSPSLRRVKRAVQAIVDAILTDPSSLLGLTTLREFDEYTFVHSVNVCILSVALGRRLGFDRLQLLDLGVAALLHDIGKSRVPNEVLNKRGPLTDEEFAIIRQHPWQGLLLLSALPFGTGRPWRAMIGAYEHHLRVNASGYPAVVRPRQLSLISRIIAVADGFDAATSARIYKQTPWSPAEVLLGMRDTARLGYDPVIVKAFISLTGIYPVGTLVVFDTGELGLVHSANPVETALSRPIVRLLADGAGNRLEPTPLVDLLERNANEQYVRTIIRTEDPDRWGIQVSDYFA
jgi:HD-GYP domain-containing protein (c-di-GMP phosphodiesterase class II)